MEEIIRHLMEKNRWLEEFATLNQQEITAYSKGNFDHIEKFYNDREAILGYIRGIDERIERIQLSQPQMIATREERDKIRDLLNEKDVLVAEILSQDLEILSFIDREKSNLIQQLRDNGKTSRVLKAYKSPAP